MSASKLLDKPCEPCGWKFKGFHICLDLPEKVMQQVEDGRKRDSNGKIRSPPPKQEFSTVRGSDEYRQAVSDGLRHHHANDPRKIERNKEIIRLYNEEDMTMREIGVRLNSDPRTVMNILHQAADRGEVIIRRSARRTGRG